MGLDIIVPDLPGPEINQIPPFGGDTPGVFDIQMPDLGPQNEGDELPPARLPWDPSDPWQPNGGEIPTLH
mgnify:CR=1 FL=1|jgi:hypothetical protein